MAGAAARIAGVGRDNALGAMVGIANVAGRYREVNLGPASARLLLAKNPAGWNEILDFLSAPPAGVVGAVNAHGPARYDTSWLWDRRFERPAGPPGAAAGERGLGGGRPRRHPPPPPDGSPGALRPVG